MKILSLDHMRQLWRDNPALFFQRGLFWTFWLSIATFPIGYGAREVLPLLALCFLAGYYRHNWQQSVLARLPIRWIFVCPLIMSLIGIVFSYDIWASLLHVGRGINKGFILPFIAMECVHDEKDLRHLVWASVIACFWLGMDGVWQSLTGKDIIFAYPPRNGRLTATFGDYTVGNYIALALIPAWGCWFILRQGKSLFMTLISFTILLAPGLFLLNGAAARSGLVSLACALALWFLMKTKKFSCRQIASACLAFLLVLGCFWFAQSLSSGDTDRLTYKVISNNGRWDYWQTALKIVHASPWWGVGAGRFRDAYERLDVAPQHDVANASHPHNLYLDMLYAHGLIGFSLGMTFLLGVAWWCHKRIRQGMRKECSSGQDTKLYWRLACCFWLGYMGWLANGLSGHDFYRIWYLALAMSYLGITLGAVVNGTTTD